MTGDAEVQTVTTVCLITVGPAVRNSNIRCRSSAAAVRQPQQEINMIAFFIVALTISPSIQVPQPDTTAFYNWWVQTSYDRNHETAPKGVTDTVIPMSRTTELDRSSDYSHSNQVARSHRTFLIYNQHNCEILISVPLDSGNEYSIIRVKPYADSTAVNLHPFTSDSYNSRDVDFRLFWLPGETMPELEIISSGPACIPMDLFHFDQVHKVYKRVRHLCGA